MQLTTRQRNYTGQRFGALFVVAPHHSNGRQWLWTARCNCGQEKIVRIDKLVAGKVVSCGCGPRRGGGSNGPIGPRVEWTSLIGTRTYKTWASMLSRCENPNHLPAYQYYGATGISVCARWRKFGNFLADMGERPPGTSIDRINPYGNYEPGNCRWATPLEQRRNRRKPGTAKSKF